MSRTATGIIQAAAAAHGEETAIGSEIGCAGYDTLTVWIDYTKGDETGVYVYPKFYRTTGGTAYAAASWSGAAGDRTITADRYYLTASGNRAIVLDVTGFEFFALFELANGGTPTGTIAAAYTLACKR